MFFKKHKKDLSHIISATDIFLISAGDAIRFFQKRFNDNVVEVRGLEGAIKYYIEFFYEVTYKDSLDEHSRFIFKKPLGTSLQVRDQIPSFHNFTDAIIYIAEPSITTFYEKYPELGSAVVLNAVNKRLAKNKIPEHLASPASADLVVQVMKAKASVK